MAKIQEEYLLGCKKSYKIPHEQLDLLCLDYQKLVHLLILEIKNQLREFLLLKWKRERRRALVIIVMISGYLG